MFRKYQTRVYRSNRGAGKSPLLNAIKNVTSLNCTARRIGLDQRWHDVFRRSLEMLNKGKESPVLY